MVCLVHRRRHDDWTLPKGKLDPGEHPLVAAVREVAEETGFAAVPELPLPASRYRVPEGAKHVDFWAMRAAGDAPYHPVDDFEVDQVQWLPADEAAGRLSYPRDVAKLRQWQQTPPVTGMVLLVRHAEAGRRLPDPATDDRRPLSETGIVEAAALCQVLDLFAPGKLVSAPPLRCVQTLRPLAGDDRSITRDDRFGERAGDPATAATEIRRLGENGTTTVVCSQGKLLPALLAALAGTGSGSRNGGADRSDGWATAKGDGWLLPFSGPLLLCAARLRPAL